MYRLIGLNYINHILYLFRYNVRLFQNDNFFKNSFFIFLGRALNASCGFIFWTVASRYYAPEDVGIGTTLISSLAVILSLSKLGFDISIIRFMPLGDRSKIFSTSLIMVSSAAIIMSSLFLLTVDFISPKLSGIQNYPIIFVIFSLFSSIIFLTGITFLSIKESKYYF